MAYNSYRKKNIAGNVLMFGGLALALGGAYMPISNLTSYKTQKEIERDLKISMGFMISGLVTELIGVFIYSSGQESIFTAVNMYNRNRSRELNK
jgi:hypothetical protein